MSRTPDKTSEIAECIRKNLEKYFRDLDGAKPNPVYDMVLHAVEKPTLEIVLDHAGGNQTVAAEILGINRNTLRKKMQFHRIR
jgi:Fis family transcriptional regulator